MDVECCPDWPLGSLVVHERANAVIDGGRRCCALLLALGALAACGCATCQLPRIDPTGEHLFLPPNAPPPPPVLATGSLSPSPTGQWGISVSPSQVIAPVGSEVVMIASVCGIEGYMLTNQRVEWMLSPEGAGQFLSPGEREPLAVAHWLHGLPKKIDARYVVNTTLYAPTTLDRGTPNLTDDVLVLPGQSWVTVTSPVEGTSHVTVFAPEVYGWDRRQQSATIYWVDAQWRFPAPHIAPAGGRSTLTTQMTRQSDGSPLAGWRVRYEIVGGPDAAFSPDGTLVFEVLSNETGQAPAEIFQKAPVAGTNQIQIQVIRPAGPGGQTRDLPIGTGSTLQTWVSEGATPATQAPTATTAPPSTPPTIAPPSAPPPSQPGSAAQLEITVNGPDTAVVGGNAQFEIVVANRGTAPATRLVITDRFDAGLQHEVSASPIQRDMVDLQPGSVDRMNVTFHVLQAGQLCQQIEVNGDGGVRATARKCVNASEAPAAPPANEPQPQSAPPSATATGPQLVVGIDRAGPRRVGDTVLFTIDVTNGSDRPLENVAISNNFESSLKPAQATDGHEWFGGSVLGWRLGTLDAGAKVQRQVAFKCLHESPRACNRVTVTATGMDTLGDEKCVTIVGQGPAVVPPATPPAGAGVPATPSASPLEISVADTTDPLKVGNDTTYQILVTNKTSQSLFDVTVTASYSAALRFEGLTSDLHGSILANGVRFDPRRELRAGESLSFELRMKGMHPGTAQFHAEVTSRGQAKPVAADQSTEILP